MMSSSEVFRANSTGLCQLQTSSPVSRLKIEANDVEKNFIEDMGDIDIAFTDARPWIIADKLPENVPNSIVITQGEFAN